jgi:hypothetical protein
MPFGASPMFGVASLIDFRKFCVIKYSWSVEQDQVRVRVSIPPHVIILADMESLKVAMKMQTESIIASMIEDLDRRYGGGTELEAQQDQGSLEKIRELSENHMNSTLGNWSNHGV